VAAPNSVAAGTAPEAALNPCSWPAPVADGSRAYILVPWPAPRVAGGLGATLLRPAAVRPDSLRSVAGHPEPATLTSSPPRLALRSLATVAGLPLPVPLSLIRAEQKQSDNPIFVIMYFD
jgi:hypothetical protein